MSGFILNLPNGEARREGTGVCFRIAEVLDYFECNSSLLGTIRNKQDQTKKISALGGATCIRGQLISISIDFALLAAINCYIQIVFLCVICHGAKFFATKSFSFFFYSTINKKKQTKKPIKQTNKKANALCYHHLNSVW